VAHAQTMEYFQRVISVLSSSLSLRSILANYWGRGGGEEIDKAITMLYVFQ
jgi:hypothetical protein